MIQITTVKGIFSIIEQSAGFLHLLEVIEKRKPGIKKFTLLFDCSSGSRCNFYFFFTSPARNFYFRFTPLEYITLVGVKSPRELLSVLKSISDRDV